MPATILLPHADGRLTPYVAGLREPVLPASRPARCRVAYAAAHVVCDALADVDPFSEAQLDWEATLAYRRYLWSLGLSVAEAMDTAQRGMGLTWQTTQQLIRRSVAEARACGGNIACGAGTDHLEPSPDLRLEDVEAAYAEQCAFVEAQGARVIVMASRALASCARGPDDYLRVYDRVLSQLAQPAIIHWLGDMFDPALEVAMRRRLPPGVRMYSGDDYNDPALIRVDAGGYSDALLGIFDAIAPAASAALGALDEGDLGRYDDIFGPTVPLSRHIFAPPTRYYKTGVVFMAYLNGHQGHFRMVGGLEGARSIPHLCTLFVLADGAGLLRDPELAVERMRRVLALAGVG